MLLAILDTMLTPKKTPIVARTLWFFEMVEPITTQAMELAVREINVISLQKKVSALREK